MPEPSGYHAALALAKSMREHPEHWRLSTYRAVHKAGHSVWIGVGGPSLYEPVESRFGWMGWWLMKKSVRSLIAVKAIDSVGVKLSDVLGAPDV